MSSKCLAPMSDISRMQSSTVIAWTKTSSWYEYVATPRRILFCDVVVAALPAFLAAASAIDDAAAAPAAATPPTNSLREIIRSPFSIPTRALLNQCHLLRDDGWAFDVGVVFAVFPQPREVLVEVLRVGGGQV